ncbi:transcription antitermination protein NusB, partial [Bradyrhizobium sp.]|uniref:transcription antitermination protein NusB n=1 Tax=Bradyrhizobium sp. TaxID=376 RepID=UPI0025C65530
VQALYQMDIAGAGINDIFAEFESHWLGNEVEGETYLPAEAAFFRDVVSGVVRDQKKLDPLIDEALSKGWPLKRIEAILRAVLRAGAYELQQRKDVPGRVVVSDTVDLDGGGAPPAAELLAAIAASDPDPNATLAAVAEAFPDDPG